MFLRTVGILFYTVFVSCVATKQSKIEVAPKADVTFLNEHAFLTFKKDGTWYSWDGKRENTGIYRKYHDGTVKIYNHKNYLLMNAKIESNKLTNTDTNDSSYRSEKVFLTKENATDIKFIDSLATNNQSQQNISPDIHYGESINSNAPISNEKMEALIKQEIERKIPIGWGKAMGTKSDAVVSKVIITRVGTPDELSGSFSVMTRVIGTYKLFLVISQKTQHKNLDREAKFRMYKDDFGDWQTRHSY